MVIGLGGQTIGQIYTAPIEQRAVARQGHKLRRIAMFRTPTLARFVFIGTSAPTRILRPGRFTRSRTIRIGFAPAVNL